MSRPLLSQALLILFICIGLIDIVGGAVSRNYGDVLWGVAVLLACGGVRRYATHGNAANVALPLRPHFLLCAAAVVALAAQVCKRMI